MNSKETKTEFLRSLFTWLNRDGWSPVAWDFDDFDPKFPRWMYVDPPSVINVADRTRVLNVGPDLDGFMLVVQREVRENVFEHASIWVEFCNEAQSEWISDYSGVLGDTLDPFTDQLDQIEQYL